MKTLITGIVVDPSVQVRACTDPGTVAEYADAYLAGEVFPPVIVFLDPDGKRYWLADGFHRVEAAIAAGLAEVDAEVRHGGKRHAMLYAAGANAQHGLPRKPEDKRRAVLRLLEDEEWSKSTDREIARTCKVCPTFVGKLRKSASVHVDRCRAVQRGDSVYEMDTSAIGQQPVDGLDAPVRAPQAASAVAAARKIDAGAASSADTKDSGAEVPNPDREPGDEPEWLDAEGERVPEQAIPAFVAEKEFRSICNELNDLADRCERLRAGPGVRLVRWDSLLQHLKDAKGNLWGNRPTHVCPYCHGKQGECRACNGEGWVAKHIWTAAPGNDPKAKRPA